MLLIQAEELSRHVLVLLPVVSESLLSSITPGHLRLPSKQSKALMSTELSLCAGTVQSVGQILEEDNSESCYRHSLTMTINMELPAPSCA